MKISIIIPTYNSEKTIVSCLESIVIQTWKEFEVLIIDGLSTDTTIDIIKEYQKTYSFINYVSEPDQGIYDAMNKGVALAKGEWLYFLGSDDNLYEPNTIEKVHIHILNSDLDIIYGNIVSSRFNGLYGGEFNSKKIFYQNICHQAIFFKSTVFKKIGLFDLKYRSQADWDHNMKWLASKNIVKLHIDQIIAEYADGGFSSQGEDLVFQKHKLSNYLIYNKNGMELKEKINFFYKQNISLIRQKNINLLLNNMIRIPHIIWRHL